MTLVDFLLVVGVPAALIAAYEWGKSEGAKTEREVPAAQSSGRAVKRLVGVLVGLALVAVSPAQAAPVSKQRTRQATEWLMREASYSIKWCRPGRCAVVERDFCEVDIEDGEFVQGDCHALARYRVLVRHTAKRRVLLVTDTFFAPIDRIRLRWRVPLSFDEQTLLKAVD